MDHQEVFNTIMEQCADSRVMIFSDGSVCGGSVGCGACAAVLFPASDNNHPLVETHAVGSKVSSYECEVEGVILGIRMALKYFENCQFRNLVEDVFIFSDCYAAIENIERMKFNTRPDIFIKIQDLRHQLLKLSIRIQLVHVKHILELQATRWLISTLKNLLTRY